MDKFVEEIMLKGSTLPFENTSAVYRPTVRCFSADCWFFVGQLSVVCRPTVPAWQPTVDRFSAMTQEFING